MERFGKGNWIPITQHIGSRTGEQVRSHAQKFYQRLERRDRVAAAAASAAARLAGDQSRPNVVRQRLNREELEDATGDDVVDNDEDDEDDDDDDDDDDDAIGAAINRHRDGALSPTSTSPSPMLAAERGSSESDDHDDVLEGQPGQGSTSSSRGPARAA